VKVSEAVQHRATIRGFLQDPVSDEEIQQLLEVSARAPSGGNVQPWRIYVINGQSMERFRTFMEDQKASESEYPVYPEGLHEPYRTNRYALGEAMYEKMGVGREDKAARYAHLARNFDFFDAPAAFFCFVDRKMGSAQWSDLGMFLQTFMLLAVEAGLDTCPQEAWANHWKAVQNFVQAPDNEMLFCGMAIGKRDETKKVNTLRSERMPFSDWGKFV
jgi:nitroreductase|tara:strand:- start:8022 stop:8672 length:651 start_codon:yes stop_codon:yes gene_type:complete